MNIHAYVYSWKARTYNIITALLLSSFFGGGFVFPLKGGAPARSGSWIEGFVFPLTGGAPARSGSWTEGFVFPLTGGAPARSGSWTESSQARVIMHVRIINRQKIIHGRPELYSMSKSSLGLTDGLILYRYSRWLITRVTRENFLNTVK